MRLDPPIRLRLREIHGLDRLIALLGVSVFGAAVLTVAAPHGSPTAAPVVRSAGAATVGQLPASRQRLVVRTERTVVHAAPRQVIARPAAAPVRRAKPTPTRVVRYVPSGTGMWIYQWHHTDGGSAADIVARAKRVGLSTLYVRTGSSWDGFTADRTLPVLLRATRGSNLSVVTWDFPRLKRPARDARRLAHAAWVGRAHNGAHVAAVAPDIETPAEGTFNAAWRVRLYLHVLRKHLPAGVTILSTVPWPSSYRRTDYPYRTIAAHSDVLVPMAYWYNNPPGLVTARSISYLRQFHKPVAPVGQGYDGKLDVPSLRHNNLAREVPVFLRTAARAHVRAVSIWSWQSAPRATWRALARAHGLFTPRR
ncbi:MAG TPA: hypothetical protein VH274_01900 [Mycobacteriales bacterium]|nr:hypothetical protein [Mycobacteriales bacterium]